MTLNHLNLAVTDVDAASAFLVKFAGMKRAGGNSGMGFLSDGNGFMLSLMKVQGGAVEYPGFFHIGFFISSGQKIDELYAEIIADGHSATKPVQEHAYTFYVEAPGGIRVEFGA